jgi:hypothetical protein
MFRTLSVCSLAVALATNSIGCAADDVGRSAPGPAMMMSQDMHRSSPFQGPKANTGYAVHWNENGKSYLKVSDDFVIPDTPAPSWQVIDSRGNVYLLNQFKIKNGTNRQIIVPAYVNDIVKVQVWCSFAESLLGEASFTKPVKS